MNELAFDRFWHTAFAQAICCPLDDLISSQIPVNNPLAAEVRQNIARIAVESCNPALDYAVLRVAGGLGRKVLRDTKAIISAKQLETPEGGKKLFDLLHDKIPELIAFDAAESAGRTL